ncbi:MAG: DUF3572 family protein [Rhodospirillaceae bacterium]|nr:DUF3572 family protein [Rhodospirillaceae bacterium]MDD9916180.1 DUF3572 family protein [Rhodospirillaceae bacterium]MDD9925042.1 DUF3572 family protein [Rhodospirillaceae bacterium]
MTDAAAASDLAAKALVFIAQDSDRIGRFLALTGIGPADIRERAQDPAFQGGLLDHLLTDETLLLEFADWAEIEPSIVAENRLKLPGAAPI